MDVFKYFLLIDKSKKAATDECVQEYKDIVKQLVRTPSNSRLRSRKGLLFERLHSLSKNKFRINLEDWDELYLKIQAQGQTTEYKNLFSEPIIRNEALRFIQPLVSDKKTIDAINSLLLNEGDGDFIIQFTFSG